MPLDRKHTFLTLLMSVLLLLKCCSDKKEQTAWSEGHWLQHKYHWTQNSSCDYATPSYTCYTCYSLLYTVKPSLLYTRQLHNIFIWPVFWQWPSSPALKRHAHRNAYILFCVSVLALNISYWILLLSLCRDFAFFPPQLVNFYFTSFSGFLIVS